MRPESQRLTIYCIHEIDKVETSTADWTTVGSFHPWCEALIVKIVTTRPKMSNQFVASVRSDMGGVVGMVGIGGLRDGGSRVQWWRLGNCDGKCCNFTSTVAQVS